LFIVNSTKQTNAGCDQTLGAFELWNGWTLQKLLQGNWWFCIHFLQSFGATCANGLR